MSYVHFLVFFFFFLEVQFFQDIATKTLECLDSLFQLDTLQRSMFYKSLAQVLEKLPMVNPMKNESRHDTCMLHLFRLCFYCCLACQFATYRVRTRTWTHQSRNGSICSTEYVSHSRWLTTSIRIVSCVLSYIYFRYRKRQQLTNIKHISFQN
jgi:hypothetical protein